MPHLSVHEQRERALADLASAQQGRIAAWQLRDLGFSSDVIARWVRSGRLHRLHRGVYAVGHPTRSVDADRVAAVLAVPGGALHNQSAGALHRLIDHGGRPEIVVLRRGGRTRRADLIVRRTVYLTAADLTRVDGLPVTTVARTALDVAALAPARLDRLLANAARRRRLDRAAIDAAIERAPRHRGIGPLRRALAAQHPETALLESELEVVMAGIVARVALPAPRFQVPLLGYRVDFLWPEARLVVEVDGFETHGTRSAFEDDRRRDRRLQLAGYRVLRFTWIDLTTRPQIAADQLRTALATWAA